MLVRDILNKTKIFLEKKKIESSRLEAETLISSALNWERIKLYTSFDYPMSEKEITLCRELLKRRAGGEPLAYIVGEKGFYNSSFKVSKDVLIPRSDTEVLVEKIIERLVANGLQKKEDRESVELVFYDLGTGSGCVGLTLLQEFPKARLLAIDISTKAIEIAKENAKKLGLDDRVEFYCGDVLSFSKEKIENDQIDQADIIVSNPPYIEEGDTDLAKDVLDHEPHLALFAKDKGLYCIKEWSQWGYELLKSNGYFFCEFGHEQKKLLEDYFTDTKYTEIKFSKDLAGRDRVMEGRRRG